MLTHHASKCARLISWQSLTCQASTSESTVVIIKTKAAKHNVTSYLTAGYVVLCALLWKKRYTLAMHNPAFTDKLIDKDGCVAVKICNDEKVEKAVLGSIAENRCLHCHMMAIFMAHSARFYIMCIYTNSEASGFPNYHDDKQLRQV